MKIFLTIVAAWLCLGSPAVYPQSSVTVTIEQELLNQVVNRALPFRFKHKYKGSIGGIVPWSVTPTITVKSMEITITEANISSRAKVSIDAEGVGYTETASGIITPRITGQTIVLETTRLTLPLYVKPLGKRINLGTQDISGMLSDKLKRISIDLLTESIDIDIAGDKALSFRLADPQIQLQPGRMVATARIQTVE